MDTGLARLQRTGRPRETGSNSRAYPEGPPSGPQDGGGFNLIARRLSHCRPSWERSELWVQLESRALPIQYWARSSRRSLAAGEARRRLSDPSMPICSLRLFKLNHKLALINPSVGVSVLLQVERGKMKYELIRKSSFESCTMSLRAYQAGEKNTPSAASAPLEAEFSQNCFSL